MSWNKMIKLSNKYLNVIVNVSRLCDHQRYINTLHNNDDFAYTQGFEWNKYNQTHYDVDNPPPKVVQGYKFNVCILLWLLWFTLIYSELL